MSFGKFIGFASQGNSPFIGIPVFPSRVFRHSAFYVRTDRGISEAEGSRRQTGRHSGMGADSGYLCARLSVGDAGVDLRKIHWVQAGMNEAGREEKVEFKLPAGIQYEQRRDTSISAMLLSGEIDAAISARVPDAFETGGEKIARLFPEYRAEEARYHAATGIYPIMHVIAMRRTVFERYPWVAMNLFKAFDEAKRRSLERIRRFDRLAYPRALVCGHCGRMVQGFWSRPVSLRPGGKSQDAGGVLPLRARAGRHRQTACAR